MAPKKTVKTGTARQTAPKSKSKLTRKAPAKRSDQISVDSPVEGMVVARKRGPNKAKVGLASFDDYKKKQSELDASKKKAMADLRQNIEEKTKEVENYKKQYSEMFGEKYDAVAKVPKQSRGRRARKNGGAKKTFTDRQIEEYLEQKGQGLEVQNIRISGKNSISVKKIDSAYQKADSKTVEAILAQL